MPNEQPDDTPSPTNDVTESPVATVLSSQPLGWSGITVEQLSYATTQIEWAPQADHVLTVHMAEPMSPIQQRDGKTHRGGLVTGDFTLTPAGNLSLWYWDHFLDKLHVRLTPDFVRRVATECDLNPDRIELLHNFGTHDPQIERLGLALKAELETDPDQIERLVYATAYLLQDGQSLFQVSTTDVDSKIGPYLLPDPDNGLIGIRPEALNEIFLHDAPTAVVVEAEARLCPDLISPQTTPVHLTATNYGRAPRTYITTLNDRVISPSLQKQMLTATPCDRVLKIDTGHSPFAAKPEQFTQLLTALVE